MLESNYAYAITLPSATNAYFAGDISRWILRALSHRVRSRVGNATQTPPSQRETRKDKSGGLEFKKTCEEEREKKNV
ncbi:MAG: hypothetical protein HC863_00300 [Myxococcales bacterium]|nr:hypothetical protein [Myxococcales bacterium]